MHRPSARSALRFPMRLRHAARACGRLALALVCLGAPFAAFAATREPPVEARVGRGEPVEQRFLPSGLSVVTTPRGQTCVASALLDIAASTYLDEDGGAVPFDRIVRSPAASIQAVLGQPLPDEGAARSGREEPSKATAPAFRVQLKFSPQPGTPVTLLLGPETAPRRIELASMLEGSTDSLLIGGEAAMALHQAFAAGEPARLASTSRDTGHRVIDALPSPDLAALASCTESLVDGKETGPMASQVSLRFEAAPSPETLATPEALQACRMTPTDRPLHVGHLLFATGFFAQTDTVFVAFDEDGRVERAYVPGILDAEMTAGSEGTMQVSQAADGNVPDAANEVTGCIGTHEVAACATSQGVGRTRIAACETFPGVPNLPPTSEGAALGEAARGLTRTSSLIPNLGRGRSGSPATPSLVIEGGPSDDPEETDTIPGEPDEGGDGDGGEPPTDFPPEEPEAGTGPNPDPEIDPPPLPVPLPAAGLLMLATLGGLGVTRLRRQG